MSEVESAAKESGAVIEQVVGKFKSGTNRVMVGFASVALALFIAFFLIASYLDTRSGYDSEYAILAGEQQVLSQEIAKYALGAAGGAESSFKLLKEKMNRFSETLKFLRDGNPATGLPKSNDEAPNAVDELNEVDNRWNKYQATVNNIQGAQESIMLVNEAVKNIQENLPKLTEYSEQMVKILLKSDASKEDVSLATRQLMLAQRIANHLNQVVSGQGNMELVIENFKADVEAFGKQMEVMLRTQQGAESILRDISMFFTVIYQNVEEIIGRSEELVKVGAASHELGALSDQLLKADRDLLAAYSYAPEERPITSTTKNNVGLATLVSLVVLGYLFLKEAKGRQKLAEIERAEAELESEKQAEFNRKNQEAILRMLDEMGDLADGDLTVHVTVSEDFTGAIADSVNFAIEELRGLVTTINETSVQVSSAAQETQATAIHLAEAADHQSQQITSASAAINEMAVSIDQVSASALNSSKVAQNSVTLAHKGAESVRKTIHGMDTIREHIQETSKRIKRLGESSQEIGDIIELINDIADQTNILALNAAIQAAMAGEAGRGFAVVADEVQRLAERSSNATKQIEMLVKTIQGDTNEAVASMEQSTANVVTGARLAKEAGDALGEIEGVSQSLSKLIAGISESARQQSAAAANISDTMNVIQEITAQTSAGTNETATSVGNLADLANELQKSVTGFKIPT